MVGPLVPRVIQPPQPERNLMQKPAKAARVAKAAFPDREVCPRCGRPSAKVIGRSESFPVLYLRCDDCRLTSVAPA